MTVIFAEKGIIEATDDATSRYLVLENGFQTIGRPGALDYREIQFDQYAQRLEEPNSSPSGYTKADGRTTEQLLRSEKLEDKATLQWRISLALLVPIIALIAQALSRTTHRKGRYVKMLPAFLIYLVYLVLLNAALVPFTWMALLFARANCPRLMPPAK